MHQLFKVTAASTAVISVVEPAVVREEMTVISRENWAAPTIAPVAPSRKPKEIIRPLETLEQTITPIESNVPSHTLQSDEESKTVVFSSKKTTEDAPLVQRLVENQAFVSLPVTETVEILSPRNRPGNVHHLVGISDHRITEKTSSMMPDKENLSVVVETDVIPPLITVSDSTMLTRETFVEGSYSIVWSTIHFSRWDRFVEISLFLCVLL